MTESSPICGLKYQDHDINRMRMFRATMDPSNIFWNDKGQLLRAIRIQVDDRLALGDDDVLK